MAKSITRQEVKEALANGSVTLVEALPVKYYDEGHLPEAVQMNYDEVDVKALELLPDRDAFIVAYCAGETCPNSGYAANKLTALGYTNVMKYEGGKEDWIEAGETLVTS